MHIWKFCNFWWFFYIVMFRKHFRFNQKNSFLLVVYKTVFQVDKSFYETQNSGSWYIFCPKSTTHEIKITGNYRTSHVNSQLFLTENKLRLLHFPISWKKSQFDAPEAIFLELLKFRARGFWTFRIVFEHQHSIRMKTSFEKMSADSC